MTYQRLTRTVAAFTGIMLLFLIYHSFSLKGGKAYAQSVLFIALILVVVVFVNSLLKSRTEKRSLEEQKAAYPPIFSPKILVLMLLPILITISWKLLFFLGGSAIGLFILFRLNKLAMVKSVLLSICITVAIQIVFVNLFMISLPTPGWWPR